MLGLLTKDRFGGSVGLEFCGKFWSPYLLEKLEGP